MKQHWLSAECGMRNAESPCANVQGNSQFAIRNSQSRRGFALLLVMMLVMVAAILGITYMSTASVKAASSDNLVQASRAKYLAESAVQHGMYMLQKDSTQFTNTSAAHPLGPYYADGSTDTYVFWAQKTADTGTWTVSGRGTCGALAQTSSATVFCGAGVDVMNGQGIYASGSPITVPSGTKVYGNISVKGSIKNTGYIEGNITYSSGTLSKVDEGNHVGTVTKVLSTSITPPTILYSDYSSTYKLPGQTCTTTRDRNNYVTSVDSLCKDKAATSSNPGGVVYMDPYFPGGVSIYSYVDFTGTIVVNGDLVLDGANIKLKAKTGFPAIVCTGTIYITQGTSVDIQGMVVANNGIRQQSTGSNTKTTITGALLTQARAYDAGLANGTHELHFNADMCRLYDVKTGKTNAASMKVLNWSDQ